MDPLMLIGTIVISYLIGAISFVRVAARLLRPVKGFEDFAVRDANTGETYRVESVRASSVSAIFGARFATLNTILDIAKIAGTVLAVKLLFPGQLYYLVAAIAAMAGHLWPVYYGFHGSQGFTAAMGGLIVVDWIGALVCPVFGTLFGVLVLKEISAGILVWSILLIPWMWLRTHNLAYVSYAVGVNLLFLAATAPKIRLIVNEHRARTSFGHG